MDTNWGTRDDCPTTYFRPANLVLQPRDSHKLGVYYAANSDGDNQEFSGHLPQWQVIMLYLVFVNS